LNITDNTVVSINYTLKGDSGEVIDTSEGREPLQFLFGAGMIIPGLENELAGKAAGEKFKVSVDPEQGYGERSEDMIQKVPAADLSHLEGLAVGAAVQAQSSDGQTVNLVVTEMTDSEITLDGNHPLAGATLHFEGDVVEVRAATEDEISHGHSH